MLNRHPHFWPYFALAAVCVLWGTTYLGIRMALESFPPALLMGTRYFLSGGILLIAARLRGARIPRGRELWTTALTGLVIIGGGTGALAFAETWIPSGLAALFITASPFWMVGIEALWPGGERLRGPVIGGICVGLAGTAMLVSHSASALAGRGSVIAAFLLLQGGCASWALGSIAHRRQSAGAHPVVSGAIQQLATGIAYLIPSLWILGPHVRWSARGAGAVIYLVCFGSILGYSAYAYALSSLPVAIVSIYPFVNPVIAVFLGWLIYREPFGWHEALAMAVIFAGVAIVKKYGHGMPAAMLSDAEEPSAA